jgi:adenylate cyclase, class 2
MAIEIEKKFCLRTDQLNALSERLQSVGATREGREFEENTLYRHKAVDVNTSVLRVRRVAERTILTFKQQIPTTTSAKYRREEETEVSNYAALEAILELLGCVPAVVYEKRRETWRLGDAEVTIDELPFGWFMEIEGSEEAIAEVERMIGMEDLIVEIATYPQLTRALGKKRGEIIEARFQE